MLWAVGIAGAEPLLTDEGMVAVRQAMAMLAVDEIDLAFDKDDINTDGIRRDAWRLEGVEALLRVPLSVPADAAALTDGDPLDGLSRSAGLLGLSLRPASAALPAPLPRRDRRRLSDPGLVDLIGDARGGLEPLHVPLSDEHRQLVDAIAAALPPDAEDPVPLAGQLAVLQRRALAAVLPERLSAAQALLDLGLQLAAQASALPRSAWPTAPLMVGRVLIGTLGDDMLTVDGAWLILDPGGDDRYTGTLDPSVNLIIDLAGDDTHHPAAARGVGGVSVAIDLSGRDVWPAGDIGAAGAVFGAAVLLDRGGDDTYGGRYLTQGAAYEGAALLIDEDGDDTYRAGGMAQGFGGTRGVGMLWDGGGDDIYVASGQFSDSPDRLPEHSLSLAQGFAIGERPWAGGGAGLLVDVAGNDRYIADLFAQGCSYWFSRGYLVDRGGHDSYRAWQYAQGSGIHLSVGGLFDLSGNDDYTLAHLGQGSSHDLAVGWQVDGGGDDLYTARTTAQGGALASAVTFFIDEGGDDTYMVRRGDTSRGGGDYRRSIGPLALSIDLSGSDYRDGNGPAEGEVRRVWGYGLAWDRDPDASTPPPPPPIEPPPPEALTPGGPEVSPDLLVAGRITALLQDDLPAAAELMAASRHLSHPDDADRARAALVAEGAGVLDRLLPLLDRGFFLEGYALQELVRALSSSGASVEASLLAALQSAQTPDARRWLVSWLSELESPGAEVTPAIMSAVTGPVQQRRAAAEALVRLGETASLEALLSDPDTRVRAAATRGISDPTRLAALLSDDSFLVRFNAMELLLAHPDPAAARRAVEACWPIPGDVRPAILWLHLEALGRLGSTRIVRAVAEEHPDPWARQRARQLLSEPPYDWRIP